MSQSGFIKEKWKDKLMVPYSVIDPQIQRL
jgi:hypothetical protein